jgi:hypothetical protein
VRQQRGDFILDNRSERTPLHSPMEKFLLELGDQQFIEIWVGANDRDIGSWLREGNRRGSSPLRDTLG